MPSGFQKHAKKAPKFQKKVNEMSHKKKEHVKKLMKEKHHEMKEMPMPMKKEKEKKKK